MGSQLTATERLHFNVFDFEHHFEDCELELHAQLEKQEELFFTVHRHIALYTHTSTHTESLFNWRLALAWLRMRNDRTLTSTCHSPSTSTGRRWLAKAVGLTRRSLGLQIDLNAKNNNELPIRERLSRLLSLSLASPTVARCLSINNAVKRL